MKLLTILLLIFLTGCSEEKPISEEQRKEMLEYFTKCVQNAQNQPTSSINPISVYSCKEAVIELYNL
jgi:hypothetical protein